MILVDQLTKRYGRYTAVDSISFSVRPGTVVDVTSKPSSPYSA